MKRLLVIMTWLLVAAFALLARAIDAESVEELGLSRRDSTTLSAPVTTDEGSCPPGPDAGICTDTGEKQVAPLPQNRTSPDQAQKQLKQNQPEAVPSPRAGRKAPKEPGEHGSFTVYFFYGEGCRHCSDEKPFLDGLSKRFPGMEVKSYEVWHDRTNAALMSAFARAYDVEAAGVPMTFIDRNAFIGFTSATGRELASAARRCSAGTCADPAALASGKGALEATPRIDGAGPDTVSSELQAKRGADTALDLPFFGRVDAAGRSLPFLTVMIAGMDSFNPCAFFVLLSLLGLMIHARSRRRMLLVGGTFVFFSGFLYFIFMAAWLNVFLVMGQVSMITTVAGVLSLIIALINIKDFFLFKKGVSLTIPESAKPKLFERMRGLLRTSSLPALVLGTSILAIAANAYELLCTAGFPMVYTRILTLHTLPAVSYYLFLVLYNVVYVVPLLVIVGVFAATLGRKQLTEQQGRVLKLLSGIMMLSLALVLLIKPELLNNVLISSVILVGSVGVSIVIASITRRLRFQ